MDLTFDDPFSMIERPNVGIIHLGVGAFFRAHVAQYIAAAMKHSGGDWGVVGVCLKRPNIRDLMRPNSYGYFAQEMGAQENVIRPVTVIQDILVAPENPSAVLSMMSNASVKIVSLTVTEKGYCYDPSTLGLDHGNADVIQDLTKPDNPASAIGYICRALDLRRKSGLKPFTVLSCDNLVQNGNLTRRVVLEMCEFIDLDLQTWVAEHGAFPNTMVDRIVPATTQIDVDQIFQVTGIPDLAPVIHEPFSQWVVEDNFAAGRPNFAAVGGQFADDVGPFERMKLRCLNGAHSALAYLGYLAGFETISDVVQEAVFEQFVQDLWQTEIIPVLTVPLGVDLNDYTQSLLQRFQNPKIRHRTWQIAMDGSLKMPLRVISSIADNLAQDRVPSGLFLALAAWMRYTSGRTLNGEPIDVRDPLADRLAAIWLGAGGSEDVVAEYLTIREIFPTEFAQNSTVFAELCKALLTLQNHGPLMAAKMTLAT